MNIEYGTLGHIYPTFSTFALSFCIILGTECPTTNTNDRSVAISDRHLRQPFRFDNVDFSTTPNILSNVIKRILLLSIRQKAISVLNLLYIDSRTLYQRNLTSYLRLLLKYFIPFGSIIRIRIIVTDQ